MTLRPVLKSPVGWAYRSVKSSTLVGAPLHLRQFAARYAVDHLLVRHSKQIILKPRTKLAALEFQSELGKRFLASGSN